MTRSWIENVMLTARNLRKHAPRYDSSPSTSGAPELEIIMPSFPKPFVALLVGFSLMSSLGLSQETKKPKVTKKPVIKALLIAGGCCHDYDNQIQILTQGLSQRANVEWEILLGANSRDRKLPIYQTDDWAKGYDVIVHNECYGATSDVEFVERIVRGHTKYKIPMVAIHCSMHSYRNAKTDKWRELLGVTSRRHEKRAEQGLEVVNRAPKHPIMIGFGESWATPKGELYVIEKSWPNMSVLASAFGVQGKRDQACIWTNEYQGCRVFGTTLGHHNETMLCQEYLDTVSRGLLWACGKIQENGAPLPGYEGSGQEKILLPYMIKEQVPGPSPTPAKRGN